jgi:hypothetical protein
MFDARAGGAALLVTSMDSLSLLAGARLTATEPSAEVASPCVSNDETAVVAVMEVNAMEGLSRTTW